MVETNETHRSILILDRNNEDRRDKLTSLFRDESAEIHTDPSTANNPDLILLHRGPADADTFNNHFATHRSVIRFGGGSAREEDHPQIRVPIGFDVDVERFLTADDVKKMLKWARSESPDRDALLPDICKPTTDVEYLIAAALLLGALRDESRRESLMTQWQAEDEPGWNRDFWKRAFIQFLATGGAEARWVEVLLPMDGGEGSRVDLAADTPFDAAHSLVSEHLSAAVRT